MKTSDIAAFLLAFKGKMPESVRACMALRLVKMIGEGLQNDNRYATLEEWNDSGGPQEFFRQCELDSTPATVNHEIAVHDTDLANFCNRWMNVEEIRRPGESEFIPITPDMHAIRYTMVKELEALAKAQKEMNSVD